MASNDRFFGVLASQAIKVPCVRAVATNVTLSGDPGLIGTYQPLDNDRLLLVGQTNPVENGIWEVSLTGAWKRSPDFDGIRDATENTLVVVARDSGSPVMYRLENTAPVVVGTDPLTFSQFFDPDNPATAGLQAVTDVGNTTDNEIVTTGGAGFRSEQDLTNYVSVYHQPLNPTAVIEFGSSTTELQIGLGSGNFVTTRLPGSIAFLERSVAPPSQAIYGQLWVRDDAPNVLVFTDDAGNDFVLGDGTVIANIATATPPSTEAVTATLDYVDADRNDTLATLGFNASNELLLRNHMRDGDIRIQQETAAGATHTVLLADNNQQLKLFYRDTETLDVISQGVRVVGASNPAIEFFTGAAFAGEIDCVVPGFMRIRSLQTGQPMAFYVTNSGNTTSEVFRATADRGVRINGTLELDELAASPTQAVGYGQVWVRDDTPNTLMFTDDAGTDYEVAGPSVSNVPLGTTDDAVLRWESSTSEWVEQPSFRVDESGYLLLTKSGDTRITFTQENGLVDEKTTRIQSNDLSFSVQAIDDSGIGGGYLLQGFRSGDRWASCSMDLAAPTGNGAFTITAQTTPSIDFVPLDPVSDERRWSLQCDGTGAIELLAIAAGGVDTDYAFRITRNLEIIDDFFLGSPIKIPEQASANASTAAFGQFWVRNDAPNTPMFTDDSGNDYVLNQSPVAGGSIRSFRLNWEGSATASPASGNFALQTVDPVSATQLWFTDALADGYDIGLLMDQVEPGMFIELRRNDVDGAQDYNAYRVVAAPVDQAGDRWSVTVNWISGTGTLTASGSEYLFSIGGEAIDNYSNTSRIPFMNGGNITHDENFLYTGSNLELRFSRNFLLYGSTSAFNRHRVSGTTIAYNEAFNFSPSATYLFDRWDVVSFATAGSPDVRIYPDGAIDFREQASAPYTPAAAFGGIWVRNDVPNTLMFTDDAGTDYEVAGAGVGGGGATVLNDLTDVNLTTPADASMFLYDTGTATWRDFAMSGDGTLNDVGLFTLGPTVTNAWTLQNIQTVDTGGAIDFLDNVELRFGTGNDYEMDYDGTNLILNRVVGTGGFQVQSPTLVRSGFALSIWDTTNNDRVSFQHDGTNLNVTEVGTGAIRLASIDLGFNDNDQLIFGNSDDVVIDFDGTVMEVTGIAATPIWNFRDNHRLRVWDSANADWLQIGHDGTNGLVGTGGTGGGSIGFEQNTFWNSQTETLSTNAATFTFSEGAGYEIDLETATGNVTLTLSGGPPSGKYGVMTIKVQQDGTAARTITWAGGTFRWAGGAAHPLTSTLNGFSIFTFETWDGGTTWYAGGNDYS
jgi:hypothetical protein